jgi:glycosyltransferase involved in cell wall biosynthesis
MNVRQICRVLGASGYAVDLACYPLGEDLDLPGVRIRRALSVPGIRSVPIGFSLRKLALDASLALLVAWLLLRRRYAAVHAVEEAIFLALPAAWCGVPVIYDLDSLLSDQLRYSGKLKSPRAIELARQLERMALAHSRAAITVCASLTDAARRLCPRATVFQIEDTPLEEALGVADPARVARLREQCGLGERPLVVYTGNLEAYQGIDLLLDAAVVLARRLPRAGVVLVGGEPEQVEALRADLPARGLEGRVVAVGKRPPAEMAEWMALASVLISPRCEGENTPLKIYTYMRSGVPIVATALATHTQVLDDATAVLCEPSADALAEAIARLIVEPERAAALAARARAVAEREYSADAFRRKLLAAYDWVLDPAQSAAGRGRATVSEVGPHP